MIWLCFLLLPKMASAYTKFCGMCLSFTQPTWRMWDRLLICLDFCKVLVSGLISVILCVLFLPRIDPSSPLWENRTKLMLLCNLNTAWLLKRFRWFASQYFTWWSRGCRHSYKMIMRHVKAYQCCTEWRWTNNILLMTFLSLHSCIYQLLQLKYSTC